MVLDASLLNTQHYKVRIKGKVEQSREGVAPSPTPWCSSYRKGSLRVTLDYGRQFYFTYILTHSRYTHAHTHTHTHICIYIYISTFSHVRYTYIIYIYIYIYIHMGIVWFVFFGLFDECILRAFFLAFNIKILGILGF